MFQIIAYNSDTSNAKASASTKFILSCTAEIELRSKSGFIQIQFNSSSHSIRIGSQFFIKINSPNFHLIICTIDQEQKIIFFATKSTLP